MKTKWTKKVLLGTRKRDKVKIYLQPPSWDCDWYWGLGYLGNKHHEHFRLNGLGQGRNLPMWDALQKDYDLSPLVEKNLWEFCEVFTSLYTLREMADLCHRGGSHISSSGATKSLLQNPELATHINGKLIPELLDYVYDLITKVKD